jgi:hypothetical protein
MKVDGCNDEDRDIIYLLQLLFFAPNILGKTSQGVQIEGLVIVEFLTFLLSRYGMMMDPMDPVVRFALPTILILRAIIRSAID